MGPRRMLKDAQDAVKKRDRTIILLTAEKREARDHVERLQKQLDKERTSYEDRLSFIDKALIEEMSHVRKLKSIIKVLEATIFCLTKKSLQIDTQAGGSLDKTLRTIDEELRPSNVGIIQGDALGAAAKPTT